MAFRQSIRLAAVRIEDSGMYGFYQDKPAARPGRSFSTEL
jgi:hypothetical protein